VKTNSKKNGKKTATTLFTYKRKKKQTKQNRKAYLQILDYFPLSFSPFDLLTRPLSAALQLPGDNQRGACRITKPKSTEAKRR
jgi:hypothetical protein